jgi:hypothetical protein
MSTPASAVSPETLSTLIATVTSKIKGRPLDQRLEDDLNRLFPADGWEARALLEACQMAIAAGWMCKREAQGIKYGRVIKPGDQTHGFSVDVVDMKSVVGPHHQHPNGEIDFVMPLTPNAQFDGRGAGWLVYGPGSAHKPTVTQGHALVLYLLPEGAIEFTRS